MGRWAAWRGRIFFFAFHSCRYAAHCERWRAGDKASSAALCCVYFCFFLGLHWARRQFQPRAFGALMRLDCSFGAISYRPRVAILLRVAQLCWPRLWPHAHRSFSASPSLDYDIGCVGPGLLSRCRSAARIPFIFCWLRSTAGALQAARRERAPRLTSRRAECRAYACGALS